MNNRLFYDLKNKERILAKQAAIYQVMAKYYQGVEEAKLGLLQAVFHPGWAMRDNDVPKRDHINVEDKPTFIQRVRNHGPYNNYAADRALNALNTLEEGWAFVQITKTTSGNSTLFFLAETKTGWLIMDKIWINTAGDPMEDLDAIAEYKVLESLLHTYQDAIKSTHDQYLEQVLDRQWNAKSWHDGQTLSVKSRADFLTELHQTKLELSEITSINLFQSKLAIIQTKSQKENSTIFFVLYNIQGTWKIACERRILHA